MHFHAEVTRIRANRGVQIKYRGKCQGVGYDTTFKFGIGTMIKEGFNDTTQCIDDKTAEKIKAIVTDGGLTMNSIRNYARWFGGIDFFKMPRKEKVVVESFASKVRTNDYRGIPIRSFVVNNTVWFVAQDICKVLHYSNPTHMLYNVDEDYKDKIKLFTGSPALCIMSLAGVRQAFPKYRSSKRCTPVITFYRWIETELIPTIVRAEIQHQKDTVNSNRKKLMEFNLIPKSELGNLNYSYASM